MIVDVLPNNIIRYPDPRLRQKCDPIEAFDQSISDLAERMLEIMRVNNGVGLAGAQVGISRQIFVCNPTGEAGDDHVYVNPVLSDLEGVQEAEEGCLSLPDIRATLRRAKRCRIMACDVAGRPINEKAEGLLARIWQHEVDHLDGRLIIDRMNATDRIANKKAIAQLEAEFCK